MMELIPKKTIEKDGHQFITITTTKHNDKVYALANKIDEKTDEITNEFNVFTIENDEIVYVNDYNLVNMLLPTFQKQIENEIEKLMKDDNE